MMLKPKETPYITHMTLRDVWAEKAMLVFLRDVGIKVDKEYLEELAKASYQMADAMIREKNS